MELLRQANVGTERKYTKRGWRNQYVRSSRSDDCRRNGDWTETGNRAWNKKSDRSMSGTGHII